MRCKLNWKKLARGEGSCFRPSGLSVRHRLSARTLTFKVPCPVLAFWAGMILSVCACGPDFPNFLLAEGDHAVLVAPEGDFAGELARMDLARTRVHAVPMVGGRDAGDYAAQSADAEIADLHEVFARTKVGEEEANRIARQHRQERQKLAEFAEAKQFWARFGPRDADESPILDADLQARRPKFGNVQVVAGLPAEFADYFEGFIAWQDPAILEKQPAREAWERLLARPVEERRYKSTWAAFMLGKAWEHNDPDRAVGYFRQVRQLTRNGFKDSVGLAAASLGLEARVMLRKKDFPSAIELYLEQFASGDPTAIESLRISAAQALSSSANTLIRLAKNPLTQKVITAYIISRPSDDAIFDEGEESGPDASEETSRGSRQELGTRWLAAVEAAGVSDVASAEALALAAYRMNRMQAAQRWIKRAPSNPVAQWLQAKLLLRAGKLDSAAALLAKLSPLFPIVHEGTNAPAPRELKDTLTVRGPAWTGHWVSAERHLHGELGVLRLSRGEYARALDALLTAGFWMDAAYVGERVLSLDELKNYVDQFWPAAPGEQVEEEKRQYGANEAGPAVIRERIRYLLARRLTRELRGDEAREYYPAEWLPQFDQLGQRFAGGVE